MTDRGHTLVELAVVLCLLGLLGGGLLGVLGGTLGLMTRTREALAAQRALRRAQDALTDDLLEMGFHLPCRGREGASFELARSAAGGTELTLLKDEVVAGDAVLAAPAQGQAFPQVTSPRHLRLRPGDLLLLEDGRFEGARVVDPVELRPGQAPVVRLASLEGEGVPALRHDHGQGAPVVLARPRRIQYRLARLPGGPALVRLETGPEGEADWGRLLRGGGPSVRVVAQPILGFRVDLPRGPGAPVPPLVSVTLEAGRQRRVSFLCAPRNGPGWPP